MAKNITSSLLAAMPSLNFIIHTMCLLVVKGELINMTRAWDKEKICVPTGIEPMTSRTPGGRCIH